jgi:hypothetical protein
MYSKCLVLISTNKFIQLNKKIGLCICPTELILHCTTLPVPLRAKLRCFIRNEPGQAGYWWFTPVILVTQEAEIRRIMVLTRPILLRPYLENT